ncbi:glycosyl hydrolase family 18 protein [Brevibacillus laterosporus]
MVSWFDYKLLGRYADRLVIMAYDEHNPRTKPGPVASIQWAEDTVRYALSQGVPAHKILLGVAGYGWNWNSNGEKAVYQSYKSLMELGKSHGATLNWDQERLAPICNTWMKKAICISLGLKTLLARDPS